MKAFLAIIIFSCMALTHASQAYNKCKRPQFLHPEARFLVEELVEFKITKSEFLEKFLWLEPSKEEYAICLICNGGNLYTEDWTTGQDWFCEGDIPAFF